MQKSSRTNYLLKILWVVGLVFLAKLSFDYKNAVKQASNDTFNLTPVIWANFFTSVIFGLYLSLVLIKKWSFKINHALLWFAAVPCLLLALIYPLLASFEYAGDGPPIWEHSLAQLVMIGMGNPGLFGIAGGLIMMLSVFDARTKKE
ncbi:hypothetical protein D1B31_07590 [Neobacillus notoginsengisoli]|uniref:Uncharacterized protein n=1 Tax=Neobacillus notoginsengisoli TaxID=1578198 RepID=A0A417YW12_9BACI|nr:hypothetical protein [Neobacillus notoginsengisoli]RHW41572.1 hypothetical protein D1B31_07590 [Neobacillus notoginsengisoli]